MRFDTKLQLADFAAGVTVIGAELYVGSLIEHPVGKIAGMASVAVVGIFTYHEYVRPAIVQKCIDTEVKKVSAVFEKAFAIA